VAFLEKTNPSLLEDYTGQPAAHGDLRLRPLLIGLVLLLVFAPLGLLATGTAWGEWSPEELELRAGYIPDGISRFAGLWQGVLPDYALPGQASEGFWASVPGYLLSGAFGLLVVGGSAWLAVRLVARRTGKARQHG